MPAPCLRHVIVPLMFHPSYHPCPPNIYIIHVPLQTVDWFHSSICVVQVIELIQICITPYRTAIHNISHLSFTLVYMSEMPAPYLRCIIVTLMLHSSYHPCPPNIYNTYAIVVGRLIPLIVLRHSACKWHEINYFIDNSYPDRKSVV